MVFIDGPDRTICQFIRWPLAITFGPIYPDKSPQLIFPVVPYHINVSKDGRACIDATTSKYRPMTTTMRAIIHVVKEMFTNPQEAHSVQLEKLWNFHRERGEFERTTE
jgi:ubiquitin-protein ligase